MGTAAAVVAMRVAPIKHNLTTKTHKVNASEETHFA